MNTESNNDKSEVKTNPNPFSKINTFYLGGFKAFKDKQEISIRPITLVFGPNSAGKSSLIKGLVYALEGALSNQFEIMRFDKDNEPEFFMDWDRLLNCSSSEINYAFSYNEKVCWIDREYMSEERIHSALKNSENYKIEKSYINEICTDAHQIRNSFVFRNDYVEGPLDFEIRYRDRNIYSIKSSQFEALLDKVQKCFESNGYKEGIKNRDNVLNVIKSVSLYFPYEKFGLTRPVYQGFESPEYFSSMNNDLVDEQLLSGTDVLNAMNQKLAAFYETMNGSDSIAKNVIKNELYSFEPFSYFTNKSLNMIKKNAENETANPSRIGVLTRYVALSILSDVLIKNIFVAPTLRTTSVDLAKILYIDSSRSFMDSTSSASDENVKSWRNFLENPITLKTVNDWLKNKLQTNFQIKKTIKLKDKNALEKLISGQIPIEDVELDGNEGIKIEDVRVKGRLLHIQDVGYGLQKLIPVLAAGSAVKYDKSNITQDIDIIAIEEPEMHLHPKLQSDLGDLFVDSVINNSDKTFILETHSEHMLLRILKRVRDGDISKDAISVLYVHPGEGENGSIVEKLELDDEGDFLRPWPSGFFDVRRGNLI